MPPPNLYACVHHFVATIARKTAGAARTRSSLRPLCFGGRILFKPRAVGAARRLNHMQLSSSDFGSRGGVSFRVLGAVQRTALRCAASGPRDPHAIALCPSPRLTAAKRE